MLEKEADDKSSTTTRTTTTTTISTVPMKTVSDVELVEIDERACNAIILNLADNVLCEVVEEDTALKLWQKLESLYMTKSLTDGLFLKQNLYTLQMKEGLRQLLLSVRPQRRYGYVVVKVTNIK